MYIDLMERAWKDDSNPTKYSKSQKKTKKQGNRNKATVCVPIISPYSLFQL